VKPAAQLELGRTDPRLAFTIEGRQAQFRRWSVKTVETDAARFHVEVTSAIISEPASEAEQIVLSDERTGTCRVENPRAVNAL
jgi:hypothetical protein